MGITPRVKAQLEATLPPAELTQQRLVAWKDTTGLSWMQIGKLMGRSTVGPERFSKGQYHHTADTDVLIRRSIEDLLTRFPVGAPATDLGKVYENESLAVIREWFHACQRERWIAVLYGPPGAGKTFGLQHCHAEFNREHLRRQSTGRAYYMRCTHGMGPLDMLARLCQVVGAPASNRIVRSLTMLALWLKEYQVLFAIDEAQGLPLDSFEVLRELHDGEPHAGMVIAGSHKLNQFLRRHAQDLEQWSSRIDVSVELPAISSVSATNIIRGEMPQSGPKNIAVLLDSSIAKDIHNGGKPYTSLRRLSDSITKRQKYLAQQEPQKEGVQ